jgi:four helix bundle protein
MGPFTDLRVWQIAHKCVTIRIYSITKDFPKYEIYGLTSQLRRAAISIEANIAEGSRRRSPKDFAHFINISEGSAAEITCLLEDALCASK